jgi:hypothetical protein
MGENTNNVFVKRREGFLTLQQIDETLFLDTLMFETSYFLVGNAGPYSFSLMSAMGKVFLEYGRTALGH